MGKLKHLRLVLGFLCCAGLLLSVSGMAAADDCPENVMIVAAPNVVNLGSVGEWVTIHTDIPYSWVDRAYVTLNEIPIAWSKYDNQGYFVGKFALDKVKAILVPGAYNILELTGSTFDGQAFCGSCEVLVKRVVPAGR